ncbi:cyclic nucleotide-binding domain-containing protein [Leptospira sp. WS58.C1]|uniref:cyclic nucleotide-binding domain-containing protein n=1 Tax=Leptospira cinconiae TaxID=3235173 RepID=UPI00349EF554
MQEGRFFGELAWVTDEHRPATVRATSACEIYTLSKSDFDHSLEKFFGIQIRNRRIGCQFEKITTLISLSYIGFEIT